jgi:hypothetical protein
MKLFLIACSFCLLASCTTLGDVQESLLAYTNTQKATINEFTAGRITREEAQALIKADTSALREDLSDASGSLIQEVIASAIAIGASLLGARGMVNGMSAKRDMARAMRHEPLGLPPGGPPA